MTKKMNLLMGHRYHQNDANVKHAVQKLESEDYQTSNQKSFTVQYTLYGQSLLVPCDFRSCLKYLEK